MNFFAPLFLLLTSCCLSTAAFASTSTQVLAKDPRWLALGHYHESLFGKLQSTVRTADFFLSPKGRTDPQAELEATIAALKLPPGANADQHAQCRFPARAQWLRKVAAESLTDLPQVVCKEFLTFTYQNSIESISLMFATGYLSNPASFFGHPLIKFNLPRAKMPTSLLDVSVNYGAITPKDENGFVYVFKGLFGGYDATFTHRQFYFNSHAYGELELRDMWEYRLNLTPEEVSHIVAHTWELIGKFFPYVFLSDNCASAMAEMVTSATGLPLIPSAYPYSLPITVFDNLATAKKADGTPLMGEVTLVPSRQTRLTSRFKALDESEKETVRQVATSEKIAPVQAVSDPAKKAKVIEALYDYYSFRGSDEKATEKFGSIKRDLLMERLRLPPAEKTEPPIEDQSFPPHTGPRPLLTQFGAIKNQTLGDGAEFRFRTAYYDFLALEYGRPKNSGVRLSDLTLQFFKEKVRFSKWELIAIETLNLSQTGLPGDGGYAWRFATGFQAQDFICENCTIFKIDAGFGKAARFFDRQIVYAMMNARAQTPANGSGQLASIPTVGLLLDLFPSGIWKSEASFGYLDYADDKNPGEQVYRWEHRFGLNQAWDVRATYEKQSEELWKLSYSRYW